LGVAGLFAFSVWAIGYYFGETIGTPLVLLVAGVVLLAVAFVAARLRGLTGERSSPPPKLRV
jgi:ABC-type xylose transport system permease subunit